MKTTVRSTSRWVGVYMMAVSMSPLGALAATNVYHVGLGSGTAPYDTWDKATNNIQAAITKAEADFGGGADAYVVVVTDNTYTVSTEIAITKAIVVKSVHGAAATTARGAYPATNNRIFNITATGALLDGFTVTNGYLAAYGVYGAGISMSGASVVRNCIIEGNRQATYAGGGLFVTAGTVQDSTIRNNTSGYGGGVYGAGPATLRNCTITGNQAPVWWKRGGGAMLEGGVLVENCTISSNSCEGGGGGVYARHAGCTVRNCVIFANTAAGNEERGGGGLYVEAGVIQNCTVAGNAAPGRSGGGVYQTGGTIRNTLCHLNTAVTGPNLHRTAGTFTYSCTTPAVSGNISADPQFVSVAGSDYRLLPGSPCIDAGTGTGSVAYDREGNFRPTDGNGDSVAAYDIGAYEADDLTNGALRCNFTAAQVSGFGSLDASFTAFVGGANMTGLAYQWRFGDGATNDWPGSATPAHTYGPGVFTVTLTVSNALGQTDAITKTAYIGVFPATVYVKPAGPSIWPYDTWYKAASNVTLALSAGGIQGTTGTVAQVTNGVYTLASTITLSQGFTVRGTDRNAVVINGNGACRCFDVASAAARLDTLTISNGYATGTSPANRGGGVYLEAGTVQNCTIKNCESTGNGGGLYVLSGGVVSNNCLIDNNRAAAMGLGAGVYIDNGLVRDSIISRNTFTSGGAGFGGGACLSYGTISNCTITGNTSVYRGAGLYSSYGTISRCTVANNVGGEGAGIFADFGLIEGCVIASNAAPSFGSHSGGGVVIRQATLRNCGIRANRAELGGGVAMPTGYTASRIESCTIAGNAAATSGGGVYMQAGYATNSIVYFNQAPAGTDIGGPVLNFGYSCSPALTSGTGNTPADPQFVANGSGYGLSHTGGDYHLWKGSPCENMGVTQTWMRAAVDLEGAPRTRNGRVNMGAYQHTRATAGTTFILQ